MFCTWIWDRVPGSPDWGQGSGSLVLSPRLGVGQWRKVSHRFWGNPGR